jgi:aldehyde:ferredoxin oxidoreductase
VHPIADEDVRATCWAAAMLPGCTEEMDPALDPLDPRSALYVFNGLLSGTFAPTGCRSSWCGRSPATGIWNEANLGGHWGAELRFAGYDGLVISGRAAQPVYLWLNGDTLEIRDAPRVGPGSVATHEALLV